MAKKLTILIDDAVYEGLHKVVGRGASASSSRIWRGRTWRSAT